MLAFLKVAMANASQRFLSVSLGKNDCSIGDVFYTSCVLHLIVGILVLICIIGGGGLMVEYVLNIPPENKGTSLIIILLLSISTFSTILSVPFDSMMVSKENIPMLSIIVLMESVVVLLGAYIIGFYNGNRLLLYCGTIVVGTLVLFVVRIGLCRFLYTETRFRFRKLNDFGIFKSILKYVGWNVVSSLMIILRNQGFAILFNLGGGVVVNAAYGIANQVNALFNYCTEAVMQPNRPIIMKAYGAGDYKATIVAATFATKMVLLVFSMVFVIIFTNAPMILRLWLNQVPDHTVYFCRVVLVATFLFQFSQGAKTLVESTGNVKELFAHIGFLHFLTLAFGVGVYLLSKSLELSVIPMIVEEMIGSLYRIYLMKKYAKVGFFSFIYKCCLKPIAVIFLMVLLLYKMNGVVSSFTLLVCSILLSAIVVPLLFVFIVLEKQERDIIIGFLKKKKDAARA